MFYVVEAENKELATPPIIWTKTTTTGSGYYWPRYGLTFKLKNLSPLPIDSDELQREWKFTPCRILLNQETFETYSSAEKAILRLIKIAKEEASMANAKGVEGGASENNQLNKASEDGQSNEVAVGTVSEDDGRDENQLEATNGAAQNESGAVHVEQVSLEGYDSSDLESDDEEESLRIKRV